MSMRDRLDAEFPQCVAEWGWKFHHLGIPTTQARENERYLAFAKVHTSGFAQSPFGVEWMRWEEDSPLHALIKTVPHLAFVVEDLDRELEQRGLCVLVPPNPPSEGVRVAMVAWDGAPVELMEFEKDKGGALL